jgi:hypothetical protein
MLLIPAWLKAQEKRQGTTVCCIRTGSAMNRAVHRNEKHNKLCLRACQKDSSPAEPVHNPQKVHMGGKPVHKGQ